MTNGKQFDGKVAVVSGAASGIGEATARAFASAGAAVVLADIQVGKGEAVAASINETGGQARFVSCDMRKETDIRAVMDAAVSAFGRLDVAFNNAGIEGAQGDTAACTGENWDEVIAINLKGVWLSMKHQIPHMLAGGGGAIVNCASIAGLVGFPQIPAYVASKHGVIGLTKTAALEFAGRGVRVNAVCPGVIATPMIDRFVHGDPAAQAALVQGEPIGRMGTPQEIADSVLWLCSSGASFTTGHALAVDGGWVAR
jgi:NAD(P)-dependent dehydrogenase (short-subunit alcohol dehydrogenase family)